jgi:hypothetical protein
MNPPAEDKKAIIGETPVVVDQPVQKSYYDQFTDLFKDSKDK